MVSTPPGQFILGSRRLPARPLSGPPRLGEPYFYDGVVDKVPIRLAGISVALGDGKARQLTLAQIARGRASRDELARSILVATALPLSGLILLMTMIVWAGIRAVRFDGRGGRVTVSSGSTASDVGTGTTCGDDDAGTVNPPSNDQVCARLHDRAEAPGWPASRCRRIVAACWTSIFCASVGRYI